MGAWYADDEDVFYDAPETFRPSDDTNASDEANPMNGESPRGNAPTWQAQLVEQLRVWYADPTWVEEPPTIQVTTPPDALCQIDCDVTIALPPDAVFSILCDPDNRRVFQNIKAVKYRKVLEDDGDHQLVEVEQTASGKFLIFTGAFDVRVTVKQDRPKRLMSYELARPGVMRRFEGFWKVDPLIVPASSPGGPPRVASRVHLRQLVLGAFAPPPFVDGMVRRSTARATVTMLGDFQTEAARIRGGMDRDKWGKVDGSAPSGKGPKLGGETAGTATCPRSVSEFYDASAQRKLAAGVDDGDENGRLADMDSGNWLSAARMDSPKATNAGSADVHEVSVHWLNGKVSDDDETSSDGGSCDDACGGRRARRLSEEFLHFEQLASASGVVRMWHGADKKQRFARTLCPKGVKV
eukprot:TRINITY_DN16237_c0_g1_i2.p1 TRINITY_DN16237_c0_g1~~TRINITY_DN16237_c0_g1_i2.p1  ORF type:complete len:410 (-),score=19.91 TRINITY_DN16237_c0_g1_i2:148-1377(-)